MYSYQSRVSYSQTDADGELTLEALVDYFQDCSTFHSADIGVNINYLMDEGLVWVLSSWQIVIYQSPKLCDYITIGTFPYDFKGAIGYRNFFIKNSKGELLAAANSIWTLLTIETLLPAKPTAFMMERYQLEEKLSMDYLPRKIQVFVEGIVKDTIVVKKHQIDSNHHVNNGQYVRMAMEYLPEGYKIKQMRAEYKKSAKINDIIIPKVYEKDGVYVVKLQTNNQLADFSILEFC